MAKFGQSLDGQLTLLFDNRADLLEWSISIANAMVRLHEKYEATADETSPILVVLAIPLMAEGTATSSEGAPRMN